MKDLELNESRIDLKWVFTALKKHFKLIFVCLLVGLLGALIISFLLVTPKYSSTTDILVNQKSDNTQAEFTAQQADLQAINTYKDVLKKPVILQPVLKSVKQRDNYNKSIDELTNSINISNETDSQVISVTVTDKNMYVASDIANTIGNVFTKKIKKMMKVDNVNIVTKATPDNDAVFPNKKLFSLVGLLLGLLCGCVIAFIKEYFNNTVQSAEQLNEQIGIISLGQIYHISKEDQSFKVVEVVDRFKKETNKSSRQRRV